MGLLTCLWAFGKNVGVQSTCLKHCPTLHSDLQQKPVKEQLKPTTTSSKYPLANLCPVTKVSLYMNNEDSVQTPPTQHCLWHVGVHRHRVLSALCVLQKCTNISQVLGAPPRTLAHLSNHGHPVWPLAMPASLLASLSLWEEGKGQQILGKLKCLPQRPQAHNHSLKLGVHRKPLDGDTHL